MQVLIHLPQHQSLASAIHIASNKGGFSSKLCQNTADLQNLKNEERCVLIIDLQSLNRFNHVSEKNENVSIMVIVDNEPVESIASSILPHQQLSFVMAASKGEISTKILLTDLEKLRSGDVLGIRRYFSFGSEQTTYKIRSRDDKLKALEAFDKFFEELSQNLRDNKFERIGRRISSTADELLLNAVFNANPRMHQQPQTIDFSLSKEEEVIMTWGFDGNLLGVSVRDPFGALKRETVIRYLDKNFKLSQTMSDYRTGLGIKSIFRYSHHLIINILENSATEAICLVDVKGSFQDISKKPGSLHIFTKTFEPNN